jgi:hypothetical protein
LSLCQRREDLRVARMVFCLGVEDCLRVAAGEAFVVAVVEGQ